MKMEREQNTVKQRCLCCEKGQAMARPRLCPLCGHTFKGKSWEGIDAHWRSKHEVLIKYEDFWSSLCEGHNS